MFWNDSQPEEVATIPRNVVDMVFRVDCPRIPMDHAWALREAVKKHLPWIEQAGNCGIHLVHGAESGNGWQRPEQETHLLLSRRTRFTIRIPSNLQENAKLLTGKTLTIGDCTMTIGNANVKQLSDSKVLFCRHLHCNQQELSEEEFLSSYYKILLDLNINPGKMMCGKKHRFKTPDQELHARSLMIADLDQESSITLQEQGIGDYRTLGMGLFIAHRGIEAVYKKADE